jgi:hypothetical protein
MARSAGVSIDAIIQETATRVAERVSGIIARQVGDLVNARLKAELGKNVAAAARRPSARREITRWVADARARRVPTFVIDLTGLDTKKKIVAKFGAGAAFERGKPLPRVRA